MSFTARLNSKFSLCSVFFGGGALMCAYAIYYLQTNRILMEDNTPMSGDMKLLFSLLFGLVGLSWAVSFVTVIRQMKKGFAFSMDKDGIHSTATAKILFAVILVIPVATIPYSAVRSYEVENGYFTVYLDKSELDVSKPLRFLLSGKYRFFAGFTAEKSQEIETNFKQFSKGKCYANEHTLKTNR